VRPRMRRYSPGLRVVRAIVRCCGLPKAGGVTAWDTQCVKEIQLETDPRDVLTKRALMGALGALSRLHQPVRDAAAARRPMPRVKAAQAGR